MRSVIVALLLLTTALGFCQSPFIRLDAGLVLSLLLFCLLTFPQLPSPPRVSTLVPLSWFFSLTPPPTVSKQLPLTKNKHKVLPDVSADAQGAFRDPEFLPVQATCDEGENVCISDALLADFNVGNLSFVNGPPPESCVSSADRGLAFSRSPVVGQSLIVTVPWSGGEPSPSQPAVSSAAPALPRDVLTAVDLFPRAVSVGISAFNSFQTLGESELESPRRTATSPLPSPLPPSTTVPPPAVPQPRSILSVLAAPLGSRGDVEAAEAPLLALPAAVEVVGDGGDIRGLLENGKGVSTANRLDDWIENGGLPALLDSCNVTDNGVDDIGLLRARVLVDHLLPSFIAAMAFYLEIVALPSLWYILMGSVMRMEIILVLLMNKSETRMDFYPWTTVGDLKMRIEEKSGFGRQWQRLIGNGEVLSDEGKLLSSYDINNGSTIHLVLTLRGTYMFYFTLHHLLTFFFLRCTGGGGGDDGGGSSKTVSVEEDTLLPTLLGELKNAQSDEKKKGELVLNYLHSLRKKSLEKDEFTSKEDISELDASTSAHYDSPLTWKNSTDGGKDLYDEYCKFYWYNIAQLALNKNMLKFGVCPLSEQRLHYFSLESDGIIAQNYPPKVETGRFCNVAFSKPSTGKAMRVKSSCQFKNAQWLTKSDGTYKSDPIECAFKLKDSDDAEHEDFEMDATAVHALFLDWFECYPTTTINDADFDREVAKLFSKDYVTECKSRYANVLEKRAHFIENRPRPEGGPKRQRSPQKPGGSPVSPEDKKKMKPGDVKGEVDSGVFESPPPSLPPNLGVTDSATLDLHTPPPPSAKPEPFTVRQ